MAGLQKGDAADKFLHSRNQEINVQAHRRKERIHPCQIGYLRTLYFHKQGFVATINLDDFQKFFEKQRSAGSK
jgi:hypothetical protein